jgi:pimeloyl-ACP methyl ester carboxylesterase
VKSESGIAYERIGAGETLVLMHGTGGSRMHWTPVVDPLAARRELLLLDLPGHGESEPAPDGVPPNPIGFAQVLAGLLDELDIDSAHLAGNSVGGWTALELAKLGRARSVVALNPAGLWMKRDPWRAVFKLWSQHKMGRLTAPLTPRLFAGPTGRALLMKDIVAKPRQVPADAAVEMAKTYAQTPTFDEHLSATRRERFRDGQDIGVPVTVAWGEKDRLLPAKARHRDELPEHARVIALPGCGHLAMWDDPALVALTILEGEK